MRMRSAIRVAASTVGVYAGLLGMEHGVFEILQGNVKPGGLVINANGPPCQADAVWHACQPAMTVIPSFFVTGVLAVIVGLTVLIWAAAFVQRRDGGVILILLSILLLLVGGGFIPPMFGILAGVAGSRIDAPLAWWRERRSATVLCLLAKLWPWTLIAFALWSPAGWILGYFFNQAMLRLGPTLFFVDLALPLLTVLTGIAHDVRTTRDSSQVYASSG